MERVSQMDKGALLQWLDAMDFGLFKDFPDEENDMRIQEIYNEEAPELWVADANYNAAKYLTHYRAHNDLQQGRHEETKKFIDKVISADPTNIHAWCNRVMFNLLSIPTDLGEAQAAARRVLELLDDADAKFKARVHKANFLCTKTEKSRRDRGLEIFAECLDGDSSGNASFHYFYLKALVRKTKTTNWQKPERAHIAGIVGKFFDQCVILFEFGEPINQQQVFLFLADLQRIKLGKHQIQISEWETLKDRLGLDQLPNIPFCLEKLEELERDNPDMPQFANLYSRIGRHYLDLAQECMNKSEREKLLKKGLEKAEKYKTCRQSRISFGPLNCATIKLELWALKYYEDHKEHVEAENLRRGYGKSTDVPVGLWRFLTRLYHSNEEDTGTETRPLLEEAHKYMQEHYDAGGPFIPIHPRVMSLLGESSEAIELLYESGPFDPLNVQQKVVALEHKGLFYESLERYDKAIESFEAAIQLEGAATYQRRIAKPGLKRLHNWTQKETS